MREESDTFCGLSSGDLAVIRDAIENEAVTDYMQSFSDYGSCDGAYPWLGAQDCASTSCTWVDGSEWVRPSSHLMVDSFADRPQRFVYSSTGASDRTSLDLISASIMRPCTFTRTVDGAHIRPRRQQSVSLARKSHKCCKRAACDGALTECLMVG